MASSNALVEEQQSVDTDELRYEVAPDESPSEAVLTAVAEATGRPLTPFEAGDSGFGREPLPSLFEAVDPEALDSLTAREDDSGGCLVTFTYAGCTVNVDGRAVTVSPQA